MFSNKRIVVTGGAGFLGSFVVEQLRKRGCREIVVPRSREYDLVEMEARELVAGAFLDSVTIVPVSAVSGAGIAELREALASVARRVKTKDSRRPFRLPVDRVFTMTGFGTVVTGTVLDGWRTRPRSTKSKSRKLIPSRMSRS